MNVEMTQQQVELCLAIINNSNFRGQDVEMVGELKKALQRGINGNTEPDNPTKGT